MSQNVNPVKFLFDRQTTGRLNLANTFMRNRLLASKNLFQKNLYGHSAMVRSIEFSKDGKLLVSGK